MCGLVGFASNSFAPQPMKELFKQMLLADTLRGHHATGVAAIDTINNSSTIYKRALPGPMFLADPQTEERLFAPRHNFDIYLGHNRWATAGKADDDANAHPFEHDHIIGAHNGTVRDRSLLEDHHDFVVDSDNVFYHMALHGLADTVRNLDGAFCLTWYDKNESTLNFIRNGERPLAFARLQSGCIVWASEKEMLYWLVKRSKSQKFCEVEADGKKETALWDLPEYTHFKLPYNPSTRTMGKPELAVLPKPTFRSTYHGNGYGMGWGSDDDYADWWTGATNTNSSSFRNIRERTPSKPEESAYQRTARECLEKFCTCGNIGSWFEIEFMGHKTHRTQAGYESSQSVFRYVTWKDDHKEIIMHSYNHAQCYTKDWTDADIGKRVFAKISGVIPHNPSTPDAIKNEWLGCQISVEAINEVRPPKMFSFYDKKASEDVQAEIDAYMEKREHDAKKKRRSPLSEAQSSLPQNVVVQMAGKRNKKQRAENRRRANVFAQSGQEPIAEKPLIDPDHRTDDEGGFEFRFASGQRVDISCYMRIVDENHKRCAHCAKDITKSAISGLYLVEWFDRGEGQLQQLLSCSSRCRAGTLLTCEDADQIYDEFYSQQGDV